MDKTEERIFTLLSFYSAAIPLLMLGKPTQEEVDAAEAAERL